MGGKLIEKDDGKPVVKYNFISINNVHITQHQIFNIILIDKAWPIGDNLASVKLNC